MTAPTVIAFMATLNFQERDVQTNTYLLLVLSFFALQHMVIQVIHIRGLEYKVLVDN